MTTPTPLTREQREELKRLLAEVTEHITEARLADAQPDTNAMRIAALCETALAFADRADALAADATRLREALEEMIADCTNPHCHALARAALAETEGK